MLEPVDPATTVSTLLADPVLYPRGRARPRFAVGGCVCVLRAGVLVRWVLDAGAGVLAGAACLTGARAARSASWVTLARTGGVGLGRGTVLGADVLAVAGLVFASGALLLGDAAGAGTVARWDEAVGAAEGVPGPVFAAFRPDPAWLMPRASTAHPATARAAADDDRIRPADMRLVCHL